MNLLIIFTIASFELLVNPASTDDLSKLSKRKSLLINTSAEGKLQDLVVSMSTGELLNLLQKQKIDPVHV